MVRYLAVSLSHIVKYRQLLRIPVDFSWIFVTLHPYLYMKTVYQLFNKLWQQYKHRISPAILCYWCLVVSQPSRKLLVWRDRSIALDCCVFEPLFPLYRFSPLRKFWAWTIHLLLETMQVHFLEACIDCSSLIHIYKVLDQHCQNLIENVFLNYVFITSYKKSIKIKCYAF